MLLFQRPVSSIGRDSLRTNLFISIHLSRWARLFGLSCSIDHPA